MGKTKEIISTTKAWTYEDSVAIAKPLVTLYNKVSLDLVRELYAAKQALSNPGYRTDVNPTQIKQDVRAKEDNLVTNVTRLHTFKDYLDEICLHKMTAYRWLTLYSPQEDKLYTPEEMDAKLEELFLKIRKKRVKEFGWTPEGWSEAFERKYQKWLTSMTTQEKIEEEGFVQAELFSRQYFNLIARQMQDDPTQEEILRFSDLCDTYGTRVTNVVRVEDQMTIVQVVEKALSLFPPEKRPLIARSIASVIDDLSNGMGVN